MKIECFFSGIKNANEAVQKLKNSGFNNAVVDLNDHYNISTNREQRATDSRHNPSLSSLIFTSGAGIDTDGESSPLAAASPMVSGMGSFEEITDINYKVILNVEEANIENAKQILKDCGGDLNSPNLDLHKHIKDVTLSDDYPDRL
jgi:hypothetical protein